MHPTTSLLCLFIAVFALVSPSVGSVCSSDSTVTVTLTQTTTSTATVTTGTASLSYLFLPGSPTAALHRKNRSPHKKESPSSTSHPTAHTSTCLSTSRPASHNSTCPPTTTITLTATTLVVSSTTTAVSPPASTTTVYPCASPVNDLGPTYGDAAGTSNLGLSNQLFFGDTPEGASAQSCCNACFFEIPNCIQAYWYFYEGCVVSTATTLTEGSGEGVSASCPVGTFNGLSYGPDTSPAFRSTGNIAGPCGQAYSNL